MAQTPKQANVVLQVQAASTFLTQTATQLEAAASDPPTNQTPEHKDYREQLVKVSALRSKAERELNRVALPLLYTLASGFRVRHATFTSTAADQGTGWKLPKVKGLQ